MGIRRRTPFGRSASIGGDSVGLCSRRRTVTGRKDDGEGNAGRVSVTSASRKRRFQAWNFDLAMPSWEQNCSIVETAGFLPANASRHRLHGAWGRGALPSGRLLRRDGLIRFAGYQGWQGWLSRTSIWISRFWLHLNQSQLLCLQHVGLRYLVKRRPLRIASDHASVTKAPVAR